MTNARDNKIMHGVRKQAMKSANMHGKPCTGRTRTKINPQNRGQSERKQRKRERKTGESYPSISMLLCKNKPTSLRQNMAALLSHNLVARHM